MKALVFAAGIGSRLKPFTDFHPKALAQVGGVPMLQRVLLKLKAAGISDVVVNVHHFSNQIIDFLKANDNFGLNLSISDESDHLLDTGGGLLKAKNLLVGSSADNEPIMLHNADILTDAPIADMLSFLSETGADATLLTSRRSSSRMLFFDKDSHLLQGWQNRNTGECIPTDFNPDSQDLEALAFNGVHIIKPSIFPLLEQYAQIHGNAFSITPFYLSAINNLKISGFTPEKPYMWHDIGTPAKLIEAERAVSSATA